MKYKILFLGFLAPLFLLAQETCNNGLLFEEQNGLLVIEMESVELNSSWKMDTTASGFTGKGYIFWEGTQYFSSIPNRKLYYSIKINNPGTYKFSWRMRVGKGTETTEHNDTWLKVEADDFYARTSNSTLKPKPQCQDDPNAKCPNGSSLQGYFKVYGNTTTFRWAAGTSDHDPHFIFATFDNPGEYRIILDARSSFCFLDRMVLRQANVPDYVAWDTDLTQSPCTAATSIDELEENNSLEIYPNPASNILNIKYLPSQPGTLEIRNVQGLVVQTIEIQNTQQFIDIQYLMKGMYYLTYQNEEIISTSKFLKI
ncbi:MAG: T9SS type A sorting domain-containing protein [Bacteroidota bacterium]